MIGLGITYSVKARKPGDGKAPPAEAIEACQSQSDGDSCTMTAKGKDSLDGTCRTVPSGEFACVPNRHKKPGAPPTRDTNDHGHNH